MINTRVYSIFFVFLSLFTFVVHLSPFLFPIHKAFYFFYNYSFRKFLYTCINDSSGTFVKRNFNENSEQQNKLEKLPKKLH